MNLSIWKRIIRSKFGVPLGMCILFQGLLMAVVGPLLPIVISNRIGLDKPGVTVFFVISTLIGIAVTLVTGYLSDGLVARHKLALVCGGVAMLGYLGLAVANQPIHAYIAGALTVAVAVLFPQLFAGIKSGIMADWERDAQVVGITTMRTLFSFGFIVGTALASWLAHAIDIQAIFLLSGGALLGLTLYTAFTLYHVELHIVTQTTPTVETTRTRPVGTSIVLPAAALVIPLLALTIIQGANSTRGVYLSLVTFHMFGDASIAPLMFGITAAAELVTMGLLGYLSSKIGEKAAICLGALTAAVYFVVHAYSQSLTLLYVVQLAYAVNVASLMGVAMVYVQGLLGHRAGMGGSVFMAVLNLGSLIGILAPLLVAGYDQKIFVIPAVLSVVGAALLMFGDRTAQIERRLRMVATQEAPRTTSTTGQPAGIKPDV